MTRARLPIANPCREDFSGMSREGARSFCDKCEKHVHDLTAMTKAEAGEFLAAHQGERICVSYRTGADGALRFRPAPAIVKGGAVAALAGLMAACTTHGEPLAPENPETPTCRDSAGFAIPCDEVETVIPEVDPGVEPLQPIVDARVEPEEPQVEGCPLPSDDEPVLRGDIAPDFTPRERQQMNREARRERRRSRRG